MRSVLLLSLILALGCGKAHTDYAAVELQACVNENYVETWNYFHNRFCEGSARVIAREKVSGILVYAWDKAARPEAPKDTVRMKWTGCPSDSPCEYPVPATHHPSLPTPKGDKAKKPKPHPVGWAKGNECPAGYLCDDSPSGYGHVVWLDGGGYICEPEGAMCRVPSDDEVAAHKPAMAPQQPSECIDCDCDKPERKDSKGCRDYKKDCEGFLGGKWVDGSCVPENDSAKNSDEAEGVWVTPLRCVDGDGISLTADCAPQLKPYPPDYKMPKGEQ